MLMAGMNADGTGVVERSGRGTAVIRELGRSG